MSESKTKRSNSDMTNETESWVNLETIATHLAVSTDTIRAWIKKGAIPCYRAGKQYKFRLSEINKWLKSGEAAKIME